MAALNQKRFALATDNRIGERRSAAKISTPANVVLIKYVEDVVRRRV